MTVQDMLFAVLPRLKETSGVDIFQSANAAVRSIGKRLAARRSDLVKAPLSLTFPAGPSLALAAEVVGFAEDPYAVSGTTRTPLTPLRPAERADLDKEGTPQRYELIGSTLSLFPYPATEITVKGMGFSLPVRLTELDDALPWADLLDELLTEATVRTAAVGPGHAVDPAFQAYVDQELDRLLPSRSARPRRAASHHF
jgi:hypothetical protein